MNIENNAIYKIKQDGLHPHRSSDGKFETSRHARSDEDAPKNQRATQYTTGTSRSTRSALAPVLSASGKALLRKPKELVLKTGRLYHRMQRDLDWNVEALSSTYKSSLRKLPAETRNAASNATSSMAKDSTTFEDDLRYVPGWSKQVTLSDGLAVTLRPLLPEDRAGLKEGFERLSAQSRYQRFMSPMDELPERYLEYLTNIDYRNHFAVVAGVEDPVRFKLEGLGIARFITLSDIEDEAELAITVSDEAQGRGLGVILMGVLLRAARERGLRALRAEVLPTNTGMQKLAEKFGGTRASTHDGLVTWRVPVPPANDAQDD